MTPEERYQAKLHKKQLDEKYLEKQLLKISENKSEILLKIRKLKRRMQGDSNKRTSEYGSIFDPPANSDELEISDEALKKILKNQYEISKENQNC